MYLLGLYFENAKKNGAGSFSVEKQGHKFRKWTLLPSGRDQRELLQLMALACGGASFIPQLPCKLHEFRRLGGPPLRLEFMLARHASCREVVYMPPIFGSGMEINDAGMVKTIQRDACRLLPGKLSISKPSLGNGNSRYFFLAYGPYLCPHQNTDDFDFEDPFHRVSRFHTLFSKDALVTDPVAFLTRLHYRAVLKSRFPAQQSIRRVCHLLEEYLEIDTGPWVERGCDFELEWSQLWPWQKRAALPALDAVRHIIDAFPRSGTPLDQPGITLLDRPDLFCTQRIFPRWIMLMDRLLPSMQYITTLPLKTHACFPHKEKRKRLTLPAAALIPEEKHIRTRIPDGAVLLLHLDGRLPNLALMKLSRYYKEQGKRVILDRSGSRIILGRRGGIRAPEAIYASCVFSYSANTSRVRKLRNYFGKSLILGGSGIDVRRRLPLKIEKMPADYTLYPELDDVAIGFITRGCPFDCPFCIVPEKEGKICQASSLDDLLQGNRKKLILLDDNILAHPSAGDFLEDMVRRDLQVNFTQTLDIRLLDREIAGLLRRIRCSNTKFTRTVYHFSLNDTRYLNQVLRKYRLMGFTPGDNCEFICMYGYNTTLAEDVERFRFLKSLPGAYVFVQQYRPTLGGPPPDLAHFFDHKVDELIDELIGIVFGQNMKSMEKYYGWLSKLYAKTFNRLHKGLVDTLFRYNRRHEKGRYIATLARTRRGVTLP